MSGLEHRYRRMLRLLPASYREEWEEEMVVTFLAGARSDDPEEAEWSASFGRPSRSEIASVAFLAVRLRLGGVEAPPRSFLWGEAVRRFALVGLLVNAVAATTGVGQQMWYAGWLAWPPVPGGLVALADPRPLSLPRLALDLVPVLAWAAAFLLLVLGRRRVATALAGCALLPLAGVTVLATAEAALGRPPPTPLLLTAGAELVIGALVVVAMAAFHRDAPAVNRRPWLIAYVVGLPLSALPGLASVGLPPFDRALVDWPGVLSMVLVVAGVWHLARRPGPLRQPAWALALALLAAVTLGLRVVSLVDYGLAGLPGVGMRTLAVGVGQALAVAGVGILLARRAAGIIGSTPSRPRGWRRDQQPADPSRR